MAKGTKVAVMGGVLRMSLSHQATAVPLPGKVLLRHSQRRIIQVQLEHKVANTRTERAVLCGASRHLSNANHDLGMFITMLRFDARLSACRQDR